MLVTEEGYIVAIFKEEKSLIGTPEQYVDTCEKVIQHFVTIIQSKKLIDNFDKDIMNDALLIKNIASTKK